MKKGLLFMFLTLFLTGCNNTSGPNSDFQQKTAHPDTDQQSEISFKPYTETLKDNSLYLVKYHNTYTFLKTNNSRDHIWSNFDRNEEKRQIIITGLFNDIILTHHQGEGIYFTTEIQNNGITNRVKITDTEHLQILGEIIFNTDDSESIRYHGIETIDGTFYLRLAQRNYDVTNNTVKKKTIVFPYSPQTNTFGTGKEIGPILFVPFDRQQGILIGRAYECFDCCAGINDIILYNRDKELSANIGYVDNVRIITEVDGILMEQVSYEPFNITYKECLDCMQNPEIIYTPSGVRKVETIPELFRTAEERESAYQE